MILQNAQEGDLLFISQMMQGVGRYDEIIVLCQERLHQSLCEIALIKMGMRHLFGSQLNHPCREVLAVDRASVFVQLRCERSGAKADVQDNSVWLFHDGLKDGSQHIFISGERIGFSFIRYAYSFVVSVCPQVESFIIKH